MNLKDLNINKKIIKTKSGVLSRNLASYLQLRYVATMLWAVVLGISTMVYAFQDENKILSEPMSEATLPANYPIDTTISLNKGDFEASYRVKGAFYLEGLKPDTLSFNRMIDFGVKDSIDFSWFAPWENKDVSKYGAKLSGEKSSTKITLTARDEFDKYRMIELEDGKEPLVITNQGEISEVSQGWIAQIKNVGGSKFCMSITKGFKIVVNYGYDTINTIGKDSTLNFMLNQLLLNGLYDPSTNKPMNYLEIYTKASMQINFGYNNGKGKRATKDTMLTKVVIVEITNKYKYPEDEAKWFASMDWTWKAGGEHQITGALYTIGMPKLDYEPTSYYRDSLGWSRPYDDPRIPAEVRIRGTPYDSSKQTMIFGSFNHRIGARRIFDLVKGQRSADLRRRGATAIAITFGFPSITPPDIGLPTLQKSDSLCPSDGFEIGEISYNDSKGIYVIIQKQTFKEADFGHRLHVKVIRNDSLVIWDTDVRAQEGATYKIWVNTNEYEKQEPMGVEENKAGQERIYPNPTDRKARFEFEGSGKQEYFNVYDEVGRIVKSILSECVQKGESGWIDIDFSGLPAGVYYVSRASDWISKKLGMKKAIKVIVK